MSRHEGVSCDSCLRNNFKGRRYKCLVCFDYDLCENCFESGAASARHVSSHAMQCMLPRAEYELYYAGESASLTTDAPLALTCPYCGRMGLTEAALYEHACCEHSDLAVEVVCPVCASQPGGEPNNLVLDFIAHIQREHRTTAATGGAGGGGDEGHGHHVGGGHHGVPPPSHSSGLQIQQTASQQQNGTSVQHDLRQQPRRMPSRGATAGGGSGGGLSSRTSRRHQQMAFAPMPLSPRDSAMESITELLSQLSGTRRAVSAAAAAQSAHSAVPSAQQTIQQLQMQLERQHSALTRQQLSDKLPRRTGALLDVGGAGGSGLLPPHQAGTLTGGQQDGGQPGSLANGSGQSQFLLARYLNDGVVGSGGRSGSAPSATAPASVASTDSPAAPLSGVNTPVAAPDRAQFVENLLLNSLLPNSALWKLHCATAGSSQKQALSTSAGAVPSSSSSNGNNNNNNNAEGRSKYSQNRAEGRSKLNKTSQDNSRRPRQQLQEQVAIAADQANTTDDSSIPDDEEDWGEIAAAEAAAMWDNHGAAGAGGAGAGSFSGGPVAHSGEVGNSDDNGVGDTTSRVTSSGIHNRHNNDGSSPPAAAYPRR